MKSIKTIITTLVLFATSFTLFATNYTVSTATDLKSKLTSIVAGDTLFITSGTYSLSASISLTKNGTSSSKICVMAKDFTNRPILDFAGTSTGTQGISLRGDYWHIKGLKIANAGDNGMHIESSASYNTVEFCDFYKNEDTGLQIDAGAFNNLIKNCDSYFNADARLENADGFACKMDAGTGNTFEGCRAWRNLDDGWDGYLRDADNITTTYINCWAFRNGYNSSDAPGVGDGNGFKTGGSDGKDLKHNGIYKNCIAAYNRVDGFDHNSNRGDVTIYNCLSTENGTNYNFSSTNPLNKLTIKNSVAIGTSGSFNATTKDISYNSWNLSVTANASDYNSILLDAMDDPRGNDGSLPTSVFKIVAGSDLIDKGTNVGLTFSGTAPDLGPDEYSNISAPTLTLTSGSNNQSVPATWPISEIVYTYGGTATGANVSGLPSGVNPTTDTNNKTISISGQPSVEGTFNYTITTTQSSGTAVSLTGTIVSLGAPTLTLTSGSANQNIYLGNSITTIVYTWGGGATDANTTLLPDGLSVSKNNIAKTITISGTPSSTGNFSITVYTSGGNPSQNDIVSLNVTNDPTEAAMSNSGGSLTQSVSPGNAITPIVLTWGGGSTGISLSTLPSGLTAVTNAVAKTVTISGTPTASGAFTATTIGGTQSPIVLNGNITVGSEATETFESLTSTILSTGSDKTQDLPINSILWKIEKTRLIIDAAYAHGGVNSLRMLYGTGALITPVLADNQTVKFWLAGANASVQPTVEVYLSTDGGITWGASPKNIFSVSSTTYSEYSVVLNEAENNIKLKICNKGGSSSSSSYNVYIDDLTYTAASTATKCFTAKVDATILQTADELIVQGVEVNSIQIYSVQGSKITSAEASQTITISNLIKGIYVAVITTKEGCFSKKISIQ